MFPNGQGSYVQTLRGIRAAQSAGILGNACVTLTPLFPYPLEIIVHLLQLGFRRIVMKPMRGIPDAALTSVPEGVSRLKSGYASLACALVEWALRGSFDQMSAIMNWGDLMGRFLLRVVLGERTGKRCHAGLTDISVSPDGRLSACSNVAQVRNQFIGGLDAPPPLGGEHTGLCKLVTDIEYCSECWSRLFCGGPCHALLPAKDGSGDSRDSLRQECELIRHLVELAMWMCTELSDDQGEPLRTLVEMHKQRISRAVPFAGRQLQ
jgi:radical SAM protein with 4Fe4S-binding SPASM domain